MDKLYIFPTYAFDSRDITFSGNNDDRQISCGLVAPDVINHLFAIHDRHVDVDQCQIYPFFIQNSEPFSSVWRLIDFAQRQTRQTEDSDDHGAHYSTVVHDKDVKRHVSSPSFKCEVHGATGMAPPHSHSYTPSDW